MQTIAILHNRLTEEEWEIYRDESRNAPAYMTCSTTALAYWDSPEELLGWACVQTGSDPNSSILIFPDGIAYDCWGRETQVY